MNTAHRYKKPKQCRLNRTPILLLQTL